MESSPTPGRPEPSRVRAMFDRVAPRYDLLNRVLSLRQDQRWRRRAAAVFAAAGAGRPRPRVLDLCTGTGDLLLAVGGARYDARLFGADFSRAMLALARRKVERARLAAADGLALPFADGAFDAVMVGFGVRNLADRARGFREVYRVLAGGGSFVVLEFSPPAGGALGALSTFYCMRLLPRLAALFSGDRAAYRYLPESVALFPGPAELAAELAAAGFAAVRHERLGLGTVALHVATKACPPPGDH